MRKTLILVFLFIIFFFNQLFSKELSLTYNYGNPPIKFQNDINEPDGILIDIWKLWSLKTGIDLVFKEAVFSETLNLVEKNQVDIHAGLFYTKQRKEFLDYSSKPIIDINYYIFHHKDIAKIDNIEQLKPYIIGVPEGFTYEYMKENLKDATLKVYKNPLELYDDVIKGEIKTFISPKINFEYYLKKKRLKNVWKYDISKPLFKRSYYAAVKKGNTEVLKLINEGFSKISVDEINDIQRVWLRNNILDEKKEYIISCDIDYAPFSTLDTKAQPSGVLIDYWRLWAKKENVKVKFIFNNWNESIQAVNRGLADFHSGFDSDMTWSISSKPFFQINAKIFYPKTSISKNIIDFFGKKLASISPTYKSLVETKYPNIQVIVVKDYTEYFKKLRSGEIEGFIDDAPAIDTLLNKQGREKDFSTVKNIRFSTKISAVTHNLHPEIIEKINSGIDKITPNEKYEIFKKWLKFPSQSLLNYEKTIFEPKKVVRNKNEIFFNGEEKAWLKENPTIKIAMVEEWKSDNEGNNIHTEVLRLLNKYSDLDFAPAKFDTWGEAFDETTKGTYINAMMNLSWSKEREENNFYYTKPYDLTPGFLIVKKENINIDTLKDLKDKTVYLKEKVISHKIIEELPFHVNVIDVKSDEEMMRKLSSSNEAQAAITYTVNKEDLEKYNLKIVKHIYDKYTEVSIGVSHKHKPLKTIINKVYDVIPKEEMVKVRNRSYIKSNNSKLLTNLTEEEINWVREHKTIRVSNELDWAPFDYNEKGFSKGISIDIAKEILLRAGIKPEFVSGTWAEVYEKFKNKEIDLIHPLIKNKERENFTLFANPHIQLNNVLVVKNTETKIRNLNDMAGKRLAVAKGWANHELLRKKYPLIKFVEVDGTTQGLEAVAKNRVDAYTDTFTTVEYIIKKNFLANLKIIFESDFINELGFMTLHFGVRNDWPILHSIIKKGLNSLTTKDMEAIYLKYGFTFNDTIHKIFLTRAESTWIKSNQSKIKVCVDPNWMPFEKIDENGIYTGIGSDYIRIFQNKLGYPFEIQKTKTWLESIEAIKSGRCDILPLVMQTKERLEYMDFTNPYVSFPLVLATRTDELYIDDIKSVLDKKLAVVKGYAPKHILEAKYPNINLIEVENVHEGLLKVSDGEIYGFLDATASIGYEIQRYKFSNLKISGKLDNDFALSIGVRKNTPELLNIAQKVINSLKEQENVKIYSKWISVKYEHGFDYTILWNVLGGVFVIIVIFIYWNRKLAYQVELRLKAEKEAIKANEAKSLFLARMSHEIRTPMNAILGMLYLTQKTELNSLQRNYIVKSKSAAQSLLRIINDILDFSKIEAGKLDIDNVDFNFNDLISRVASVMSFRAEDKGIELLIKHNGEIPIYLIGDPLRIEQVLINLIGNAIKFTSKGEVIVIPRIQKIDNDQITLMFCVEDTGIGIPTNAKNKLFKEFSQVDGSTTRKYGGTGLGLTISKKLTNMMGGDIWLQSSEENKGSTFCFTINCKISNIKNNTRKFLPSFISELKTLVVDDNIIACNILYEMLCSLNIKTECVNSGEEAIDRLVAKKEVYDLVFLDFKMDELNGFETFEIIKAHLKEKTPKTIMISAHSHEDIQGEIEDSGLSGFISKPVTSSILYDAIVQTLGNIPSDDKTSNKFKSNNTDSVEGKNILLVEDNEINQEFGQTLLESYGTNIDIANDGLEALELIKSKKYDLILMDIQMPNLDGIEATKKIREMEDKYFKEIPIVAMTAHAMKGDMEKSLSAGMDDHITKPINPDKLFNTLLRFIGHKNEKATGLKKVENSYYIFKDVKDSDIINFDDAMQRLGGNEKSLYEILKKFVSKYKECDIKIKDLVENKELESAIEKVHELKGTSSNISATKLYDTSIELEKILKEEQTPSKELWEKLNISLNELIAFIDTINFEEKIEKKSFDKKLVLELLNSIDENLEKNIINSQNIYEELVPYLNDTKYKGYISKIGESLSNFDTDETSNLIKELIKKLGDD